MNKITVYGAIPYGHGERLPRIGLPEADNMLHGQIADYSPHLSQSTQQLYPDLPAIPETVQGQRSSIRDIYSNGLPQNTVVSSHPKAVSDLGNNFNSFLQPRVVLTSRSRSYQRNSGEDAIAQHTRAKSKKREPLSQTRLKLKHSKILTNGTQIKTFLRCDHIEQKPIWGGGDCNIAVNTVDKRKEEILRKNRVDRKIDNICRNASNKREREPEFQPIVQGSSKIMKHMKVQADGEQYKIHLRCDHLPNNYVREQGNPKEPRVQQLNYHADDSDHNEEDGNYFGKPLKRVLKSRTRTPRSERSILLSDADDSVSDISIVDVHGDSSSRISPITRDFGDAQSLGDRSSTNKLHRRSNLFQIDNNTDCKYCNERSADFSGNYAGMSDAHNERWKNFEQDKRKVDFNISDESCLLCKKINHSKQLTGKILNNSCNFCGHPFKLHDSNFYCNKQSCLKDKLSYPLSLSPCNTDRVSRHTATSSDRGHSRWIQKQPADASDGNLGTPLPPGCYWCGKKAPLRAATAQQSRRGFHHTCHGSQAASVLDSSYSCTEEHRRPHPRHNRSHDQGGTSARGSDGDDGGDAPEASSRAGRLGKENSFPRRRVDGDRVRFQDTAENVASDTRLQGSAAGPRGDNRDNSTFEGASTYTRRDGRHSAGILKNTHQFNSGDTNKLKYPNRRMSLRKDISSDINQRQPDCSYGDTVLGAGRKFSLLRFKGNSSSENAPYVKRDPKNSLALADHL